MGVLDHLFGALDVLSERLGGQVDHDGGEAVVDAGLAGLKAVAVVQVEHDGNLGALDHGGLHQLYQIGTVGVGAGALGYLKDHRCLLLTAGLGDALDDLHVVDVEGSDGVTAVIGLLEHLSGSDQCHNNHLLKNLFVPPPAGREKRPWGPFPLLRGDENDFLL